MSDSNTTVTTDPIADPDNDWTPERRYQPGTTDQILASQRAREAQDREKAEANRPTGTEIAQIKQKQQEMLEAQQKMLDTQKQMLDTQQKTIGDLAAAQAQIKRVTPTVSSVEQSVGGRSLGGGWVELMSLAAARDTSDGKTRALVLISVSAVKSGDGMPLLEALVGGVRVASFPGVTANGDSFGGTASDIITSNQIVALRAKSTVAGDSPIGGATMTVTVMSIA
jgi:hypothetical protein